MIYIEQVFGNAEQAQPLVVSTDKVYIHKNIIKLETDANGNQVDNLYQYEEYQYTKDEFIHSLSEENKELLQAVGELGVLNAQLMQSNQETMLAIAELGTVISTK